MLLFVESPAQAPKDISRSGQELFCFLPLLSGGWVWPPLIIPTFFPFNLSFRPATWRSWMRRSVLWKRHYWREWMNLGLDMAASARCSTATAAAWCTAPLFSSSTSHWIVTHVDSFIFSLNTTNKSCYNRTFSPPSKYRVIVSSIKSYFQVSQQYNCIVNLFSRH